MMNGSKEGKPLAGIAAAFTAEPEVERPLWRTALYFASMVDILVCANWGRPAQPEGLWHRLYDWKRGLIAAEIPEIIENATHATKILLIDGCEKGCAKTILDNGDFMDHAYVELGACGMGKGKTPAAQASVARAVGLASSALARHHVA